MNRQRFLPNALGILTFARLALLPLSELSPVEAHAAVCSRSLALWHPLTGPLLPLLMRMSSAIFGANEFGLRFFAPFLMLGAGWLVWKIAAGLFDATTAAWAAVLFQVTPVVNVAAVTFTPTTLALAEAAAVLALLRLALHKPLRHHLHWWAVAAMSLLAFLTDWRLATFALAGTASFVLTRRGRSALLKWPVLPVLGGTLLVTLTAFLAWNSANAWAAFHFAGSGLAAFRSLWQGALLGYGPPLILLLAGSVADASLQRPLTYAPASLLAFAWPLISLDLLSVATTPWPQVGFAAWLPAAMMLASARLMQTERLSTKVKIWTRSGVAIAAAVQSCLVLLPDLPRAIGLRWHPVTPREAGILPGNPGRDLAGWRAAAQSIRGALASGGIDPATCFLVAERWDLAEPLAFYLGDLPVLRPAPNAPRVHVLPGDHGRSALSPWPSFDSGKESPAFRRGTAIFITDDPSRHLPPRLIRSGWPAARVIASFTLVHSGQPLRTVKVFACSPAPAADK